MLHRTFSGKDITYFAQYGHLAIHVSLSQLAHLSTLTLMLINIKLFKLCSRFGTYMLSMTMSRSISFSVHGSMTMT